MNLVARGRHVLARRPWLYWTFVGIVAACCGLVVAGTAAGIDDARRAWGQTRTVVVATEGLAPGDPLDGRTSLEARPRPALAESALTSVPDGAVARQHVAVGEVIVRSDIAATAGPRSLVPEGWSAVALAEAVPSAAAIGDPVVAVAGGVVLAADGVVVGRAADVVIVAVPLDAAPQVAHAATTGELSLLLLP